MNVIRKQIFNILIVDENKMHKFGEVIECNLCGGFQDVEILLEDKHYCKSCASQLLQIPIEQLQVSSVPSVPPTPSVPSSASVASVPSAPTSLTSISLSVLDQLSNALHSVNHMMGMCIMEHDYRFRKTFLQHKDILVGGAFLQKIMEQVHFHQQHLQMLLRSQQERLDIMMEDERAMLKMTESERLARKQSLEKYWNTMNPSFSHIDAVPIVTLPVTTETDTSKIGDKKDDKTEQTDLLKDDPYKPVSSSWPKPKSVVPDWTVGRIVSHGSLSSEEKQKVEKEHKEHKDESKTVSQTESKRDVIAGMKVDKDSWSICQKCQGCFQVKTQADYCETCFKKHSSQTSISMPVPRDEKESKQARDFLKDSLHKGQASHTPNGEHTVPHTPLSVKLTDEKVQKSTVEQGVMGGGTPLIEDIEKALIQQTRQREERIRTLQDIQVTVAYMQRHAKSLAYKANMLEIDLDRKRSIRPIQDFVNDNEEVEILATQIIRHLTKMEKNCDDLLHQGKKLPSAPPPSPSLEAVSPLKPFLTITQLSTEQEGHRKTTDEPA